MRRDRFRILVGEDDKALDGAVRAAPEDADELEFMTALREAGHLRGSPNG